MKAGHFDCVVLDLGLPDITGFELIEQIKQEVGLEAPIIIYTGKTPTGKRLNLSALPTIIIKMCARRSSSLTRQFLHRVQAICPISPTDGNSSIRQTPYSLTRNHRR